MKTITIEPNWAHMTAWWLRALRDPKLKPGLVVAFTVQLLQGIGIEHANLVIDAFNETKTDADRATFRHQIQAIANAKHKL